MKNNSFDIFSIPIWGFVLRDQQYQCQDYIDKLLQLEQTQPSAKKSNLGGYQTHDRLSDEGVFKELITSLNYICNSILQEYSCEPVQVKEMWGNINYQKDSNGSHVHSGVLSGVFYLQTPPDCGKLVLINPAVRADGHLLRASNFGIQPEHLALIIFPSWLEHYVEPNQSPERRMSISFNVGVS